MKKYFIFILLIIILSGCSVNGNLTINKDGSIKENITILESKRVLDENNITKDTYIEGYKEVYMTNLNNYSYKDESNDDNIIYNLNNDKKDLCTYFKKSSSMRVFFNTVICEEDEKTYKISAVTDYFKCNENCFELPVVDKVSLKINSKLKVLNENASEKEGNTYTWNFENGKENDAFYLTVEKKNSTIIKKKINDIKSDKKTIVIIVVGLVIGVVILVLNLVNKFNKNRIDY